MRLLIILHLCAFALCSQAQTCYQNSAKNLGMAAFYHKQMDERACAIKETLKEAPNFKIIGIDLPRIFGNNLAARNAAQFDKLVRKYEQSEQSFVLISKELGPHQTIRYRSHIKFPDLPAFQRLPQAVQERIARTFFQTLDNQAKRNQYQLAYSASVEIAGLQKLNSLFQKVLAGTFLRKELAIKK